MLKPARAQTVSLRRRREAAMRHLHSESHFCHALYALQDADGYVEALMGLAREHAMSRRSGSPKSGARSRSASLLRTQPIAKPARFH